MTTIAYSHKDKQIAFDSRTTKGDRVVSDKTNKSEKVNGVTFVFCGKCCDQDMFIEYYFGNYEGNVLPECSAFVIDEGDAYSVTISQEGIIQRYKMIDNEAAGSGCDFALAAMDFGKSARDAVKYAMTRDIYSGGRIRVIDVK